MEQQRRSSTRSGSRRTSTSRRRSATGRSPANPGFVVHELATGPLNAGIFPNRDFDPTLNPEVLAFFGPPTRVRHDWEEAKRFFNFGTLQLERDGRLTAGIVNTAGDTQFSLSLTPQ